MFASIFHPGIQNFIKISCNYLSNDAEYVILIFTAYLLKSMGLFSTDLQNNNSIKCVAIFMHTGCTSCSSPNDDRRLMNWIIDD